MSLSSGKAPPNLPPGVPPLLPNPYIMAPGLLHAYPVGSCQGQVKLTRTIRALLVLHRVQVILLTHFPLYLSLRCMAMMTYRCCRHGYPWWVCDESGDTNSRFIASWPGVGKKHKCVSRSLSFIRIITAFLLQLPQQHWLAEKATWRATLTLVSHPGKAV